MEAISALIGVSGIFLYHIVRLTWRVSDLERKQLYRERQDECLHKRAGIVYRTQTYTLYHCPDCEKEWTHFK